MRRRSLMLAASGTTPTLISGSAKRACSSSTIRSQPSTSSKPPPQAMPFTAAMIGLSRLRGWLRPPKPPTPQSESVGSPAAAFLRSQPGQKNFSPAPVRIAIRRSLSALNSVQIWLSRRLIARSIALAFGRSIVTSRTAPSRWILTPSVMSAILPESYKCVDRDDASAARPHDDRIHVQLGERIEVLGRVARDRADRANERRHVAGRLAAITIEQAPDVEAPECGLDARRRERRQQARAVVPELSQHAARAEHEHLAELRVDRHADQQLGDAVADHLLDQQPRRERGETRGRRGRLGHRAYVQHDAADVGLV